MHNLITDAGNGNTNPSIKIDPRQQITAMALAGLRARMMEGPEGWRRIVCDCQQTPRLFDRHENRFLANVKERCSVGAPINNAVLAALESYGRRCVNARVSS